MRWLIGFIFCVLHFGGVAQANPDGAPWGSADPNAAQNCASCHFDRPPITESKAISLSGLPERALPGVTYDVSLRFTDESGSKTGFLITANAGEFGADGTSIDSNSAQIRSITAQIHAGETTWLMRWRAPEAFVDDVIFFIAVNAGNDDQSSFGDEIHFKTVTVAAE